MEVLDETGFNSLGVFLGVLVNVGEGFSKGGVDISIDPFVENG
jgi:hypothetical protein